MLHGECPFVDKLGKVHSPYRAILDRCFIWPTPPPEKISGCKLVVIPDDQRRYYQDGTGILLSIGPGYWSDDGIWHPKSDMLEPGMKVLYDNTVPWSTNGRGLDGKEYSIVICGMQDIRGVFYEHS
jgi:hypothetical protein